MKGSTEKKHAFVSAIFTQFCMVFVVVLIASNIFETKEIAAGPLCLTGWLLIFSVCYIISDCVCEIWGFRPKLPVHCRRSPD